MMWWAWLRTERWQGKVRISRKVIRSGLICLQGALHWWMWARKQFGGLVFLLRTKRRQRQLWKSQRRHHKLHQVDGGPTFFWPQLLHVIKFFFINTFCCFRSLQLGMEKILIGFDLCTGLCCNIGGLFTHIMALWSSSLHVAGEQKLFFPAC